ncbi:MAG: DNA primase [Rickettsiales bacterium]
MNYPKNFLDELRNRVSVSEIISRNIKLIQKGKDMIGLCPFHSEKTPSFSVNNLKNFYHCFGCGEHGDIFTFVMKYNKVSFNEAVIEIANLAGVSIPKSTPEEVAKSKKESEYYSILSDIAEYYYTQLGNSQNAKSYLLSRGVGDEIVKTFQIGFANNNDNLINELSQKYTQETILSCGIFKERNNKIYSIFNKRIIFPIRNILGKVEAFGGRSVDGQEPKYINSPETEFFHKRKSLYGIDLIKSFSSGNIVVVEGYMDVVSLLMNGVSNVVATLGTSVTSDHLKQIWRISPEPIFCMDGDEAGKRSMNKVALLSMEEVSPGKTVKFFSLPSKLDPDDYIKKHGKEKFLSHLKDATSLAEYLWEEYFAPNKGNSPENKLLLEKKAQEFANQIKNKSVSKAYLDFFKKNIWHHFKSKSYIQSKFNNSLEPSVDLRVQKMSVVAKYELLLMKIILQNPNLVEENKTQDFIINHNFRETRVKKFFDELTVLIGDESCQKKLKQLIFKTIKEINMSNFALHLDKTEINHYITCTEEWFYITKLISIERLKEECNNLLQQMDESSYQKALLLKKEISELEKSIDLTIKDRFL